jgi:hypothetical protein
VRNTVAAILIVAMLVTSGVIALDFANLMRTPHPVTTPHAAVASGVDYEPVIATFYDAANALLAGESSTLLATVIAPDIEIHAGNGPAASGERGMRDYLEGLRLRGAGALTVVRQIGSSDEIAVVIEAHDARSGAGPSTATAPRWRTVDLFRMDAGMIAGYWPGSLENPALPSLPSLALPASAETMSVSLGRLEIGPDAEPTPLVAPVPHLLIVETGTLAISRDSSFEFARAGSSHFVSEAADPGAGELVAGPGDALLLPAVDSHLVRNPGKSSASALSLLVAPSALIFHQTRAGTATQLTVDLMHDGWRIGRRTTWDTNVVTESLAVKHLPLNRNLTETSLHGSQLALEPGQRHPPLTPGKLRLAVVRSGVVGVSVITSDTVPISVPNPDSELAAAPDHLFWAGDVFWIESSEAPVLANAGVAPVDILLIDIVPLADDSGATAAPNVTDPEIHAMPPHCEVPQHDPVSC